MHSTNHIDRGGDVVIEDYVWIASRVTILPGVHIGKGAVVASNAVVAKNVPSYTIVGESGKENRRERNISYDYTLNYQPWFR